VADLEQQADELGRTWNAMAGAVTPFVGRRFAAGFDLILTAARHLRARPALALVIVALTTASWFSSATVGGIMTARRFALVGRPVPQTERSRLAFPQRRAASYQNAPLYTLLWAPLLEFGGPLSWPSSIADRWIGFGAYQVLFARLEALARTPPSGTRRGAPPPRVPRSYDALAMRWDRSLSILGMGVPAVLVSTLLLVCLLGWVRDRDRHIRLADLPGYWRRHWPPVLALTLIVVALYALMWLRPLPALAQEVAWPLVVMALMFAPFAIVARGVGAWRGFVEGLQVWRRQWATVLVLFVLYRVGWELIAVWSSAAPWEKGWRTLRGGLSSPPTMLLWSWVGAVAVALLGLWLAYAFMEIAREPQAPAATVS